jgi:hypothetical protein
MAGAIFYGIAGTPHATDHHRTANQNLAMAWPGSIGKRRSFFIGTLGRSRRLNSWAWRGFEREDMGKSPEGLSQKERIAYYRGMGAEDLRLAEASDDPAVKAAHLDNASRWQALADEVERNVERDLDYPAGRTGHGVHDRK